MHINPDGNRGSCQPFKEAEGLLGVRLSCAALGGSRRLGRKGLHPQPPANAMAGQNSRTPSALAFKYPFFTLVVSVQHSQARSDCFGDTGGILFGEEMITHPLPGSRC